MKIFSDMSLLHPEFRRVVMRLHDDLIRAYHTKATQTRFEVFETYRDPIRQGELLSRGATKAAMFHSAHQFGLAVDFVPWLDATEAGEMAEALDEKVLPGWNWSSRNDWDFLRQKAVFHGLNNSIAWDRAHVESKRWPAVKRAMFAD